jgi:membrane dipeptidase
MGLNKKYDGYRSYGYLEAGVDYREFDFHDKPDQWAKPYIVPVSDAEEARVQSILKDNLVVSIHDHPKLLTKRIEELPTLNRQGRMFTAYEALSRSALDCLWDNLMDGSACITSKMGWKWEDVLFDLGMRLCDLDHQSFLIRCEGVKDVHRAFKEGKLAWVPVLESAMPIENEVDRLDILYGFGIRSMGLTYNETNTLGSGLGDERDAGLTVFGRKAVQRMNKLGMIVDVAHSSSQTAIDAAEVSEQPIIISHSGARAVHNINRLKPDDVLEAVARSGGLVGIEAAPHTTLVEGRAEHNIGTVMAHFEHCVKLIGIEHVAFGPDTNYGDHSGLHRVYAEHLSIARSFGDPTMEPSDEPDVVEGMENPTECFPNIVRWLVSHGYSDQDIVQVVGGNALRVMGQAWWN